MRVFNEIRIALLEPSKSAERAEVARAAAWAKPVCVATIAGSVIIGGVSLVAMKSFPLIGGFFVLTSALVGVFGYDAMVIARNVEDLLDANLASRGMKAWSTTQFVNALAKNTWIAGPLFGSIAARELAADQ